MASLLLAQLQPRLGIPPSALHPIDRIGRVHCPVFVIAGAEYRRRVVRFLEDFARKPRSKERPADPVIDATPYIL